MSLGKWLRKINLPAGDGGFLQEVSNPKENGVYDLLT
jgi:hypothetical protein